MSDDTPAILGFPLNRLVAFLGPYVAVASGAVADWLLVHIHALALFHTTGTQLASAITQVVVFGVAAGLTWMGHQHWLSGYQAWAYGKNVGTGALPPSVDPTAPFAPEPADPGEFGPTEPTVPPGLAGE